MTAGEIEAVLKLRDEMTAQLNKVGSDVASFVTGAERDFNKLGATWEAQGKRLSDIGGGLQGVGTALSVGLSLPLAAAAGAAIKFSSDFELTMQKTVTLAGLSQSEMETLKEKILALGPTVGVGPQALADALTVAASSGLNAKNAMEAVEIAAKAQAAGMGDAKDITRALAAVINSYGSDNISAARAGDILTAAVKAGAAEADEFAGVLNKVVPVAASMGVSFEEVAASIATYTRLGTPAAEAATGLRAAMLSIAAPSEQAKNIMAELSAQTGDSSMSFEALRASIKDRGLTETLIDLAGKFKGNEEQLFKLLGSTEAFNAVLGTAGVQAGNYRDVLAQIKDSTGVLDAAFAGIKGTSAQTWGEFQAQLSSVSIAVGEKLAPAFSSLLKATQPVLEFVTDAVAGFAKLPEPLQSVGVGIVGLGVAAGPATIALGTMFKAVGEIEQGLGRLAQTDVGKQAFEGLGTAFDLANGAATTFASSLWAAVQPALAGIVTLLTGPVGIVLAIGAAAAALITWMGWWDEIGGALSAAWQFISDVAVILWDSLQPALVEVGQWVQDVADWVGGVFVSAWDGIVGALSAAWEWIVNTSSALAAMIPDAVIDAVVSFASALSDKVSSAIQTVLGWATGLADSIGWVIGKVSEWTGKVHEQADAIRAANGQLPKLTSDINLSATASTAAATATAGATAAIAAAGAAAEGNAPRVTKLTDEQKKAADAAAKHAAELDKLAGGDKLAAAAKMAEAIEKHGLAAVIASEGIEKVNATFEKGLNVASARGQELPAPWIATHAATMQADEALNNYVTGLPKIGVAIKQEVLTPWQTFMLEMEKSYGKLPGDTAGLPAGILEIGKAIDVVAPKPPLFSGAMQQFGLAMTAAAQSAIEGGGNITQAMIGAFGQQAQQAIQNHSSFLGMSGEALQLIGAAATGASAGLANFNAVNEGGSKSASLMSSALTGVSTAMATGNPIAGLLAGGMAALGAIFGNAEKKVNDTRDAFISANGGLANLNEMAAAAGTNLNALLNADNPKKYEAAINDLKAAFEKHKQALAEWGSELSTTLERGILLTQDLAAKSVELFNRDRAGTKDTLFSFLMESLEQVSTGFNEAVEVWSEPLLELSKNASESAKELDKLKASGKASAEEIAAATKKAAEDQAKLQKAVEENGDDFRRYGSIAVGVFEQLKEGGLDSVDALEAMRPALEDLSEAAGVLGLDTSDAFDEMLEFTRLADEFGPMLREVEGLDDIMTGLNNTGLLSSSLFYDLAGQVADTFEEMVSGGADGEKAMRLIQPQIQKIWELQQDFGYEVDESTQKMIDQAVEAGLVGDKFRSAQDRMIEAVERLITRLDDMIGVMAGDLPSAAEGGAGRASTAISGIGGAARRAAEEANAAIGSIDWGGLEQTGTEALGAIEDGGARAAWGSSPTGIKEIGVAANAVIPDLQALSTAGRASLRELEKQAAESAKAMAKSLAETAGANLFGLASDDIKRSVALAERSEAFRDWVRQQSELTKAIVDNVAIPFKARLIDAITLKPTDMQFDNVYEFLAASMVDRYLNGLDASMQGTLDAIVAAQKSAGVVTEEILDGWLDAADEFVDSFGAGVEGLTESTSAVFDVIDSEMADLIDTSDLLSKKMVSSFSAALNTIRMVKAAGGDVSEASDALREQVGELMTSTAVSTTEGFNQAAKALLDMRDAANQSEASMKTFAIAAQAALTDVYKLAQGAGGEFLDTILALRPGVDAIADINEDLELTGVSSSIGMLNQLGDVAEANQPVLNFVSGLDAVMTGLANTAMLSQGDFQAMASAVGLVTQQLTDAAGPDGMRLVQPVLQNLWELWQKMGFQVDESTQKVLEQAKSMGIIGPAFESAEERMASAISEMVSKLDVLIQKMERLAQLSVTVGGTLTNAQIGSIGNLTFAPTAIPEFAEGGIVTRPTLGIFGEAGPEAIIPLDQLRAIISAASSLWFGGSTSGIAEIALNQPGLRSADLLPQAAEGGWFRGPNSGYPVMLHGEEVVVPLDRLSTGFGGNGFSQTIVIEQDGMVAAEVAARNMPRYLRVRQRGRRR